MRGEKKIKKKKFGPVLLLKILAIALLLAFLITKFLVSSTRVEGSSMLDTLHSGDRLLVFKPGSDVDSLERGDIIVFRPPGENRFYIKRVIGLPNEYIQIDNGSVFVNGKRLEEDYANSSYTYTGDKTEWFIGEGEVFVLGDNRKEGASKDSRIFGPIKGKSIEGHASFRYYPFNSIGPI